MTELGRRLKEAREAKGFSLEEVQSLTKIQKRYLSGIEEGNYTMMPGSFYVRAFIKQYAEAVDLNPEELFETYAADIPTNHEEQIPSHLTRKNSQKGGTGSSKMMSFFPSIIAVVVIVGLLFLVWTLAQNWYGETNDESVIEETDDSVGLDESEVSEVVSEDVENDSKESTNDEGQEINDENVVDDEDVSDDQTEEAFSVENVGVEGETTTFEILNADSIEVSITAQNTWAGINNQSGDSIFSQEVTGGNTETFNASDQDWFRLRIGSTAGTEIKINGEVVEFISSLSDVPQNMVFEVKE